MSLPIMPSIPTHALKVSERISDCRRIQRLISETSGYITEEDSQLFDSLAQDVRYHEGLLSVIIIHALTGAGFKL